MAYRVYKNGQEVRFKNRKGLMAQDTFTKIKGFDDSNLSLIGVASTEEIDRVGDQILMSGMDLGQYQRNPIVPWCHDLQRVPIARSLKTWIEEKDGRKHLLFQPKFMSDDPESVRIYRAYKSRLLSGFSVGFIPKESSPRKVDEKDKDNLMFHTPMIYKKIELLEISCVPCPANQSALVVVENMVGRGLLPSECLGYHAGQEIEIEGYEGQQGALRTLIKIMIEKELNKLLAQDHIIELDGLKVSTQNIQSMVREAMSTELGNETIEMGVDKEELKQMIQGAFRANMGMLD